MTVDDEPTPRRSGVRVSVACALALLVVDAGFTGSFVMSLLICPVWFLLAILKNAIERPAWRLALLRMAVPPLTLGTVLANDAVQTRIAEANAPQIITACEEFYATNGRFPQALGELVPRYLHSIPRAKYCVAFGNFLYWNFDENPILVWYAVPPFNRAIYDFGKRRWSYVD